MLTLFIEFNVFQVVRVRNGPDPTMFDVPFLFPKRHEVSKGLVNR